MPREVAEAKKAIRRLLSGRSYLLIVDDVWPDEREVLKIFPQAFKGAVVATSRTNFADRFPDAFTCAIRMRNERPVCEAILAAYAYQNKDETQLRGAHRV